MRLERWPYILRLRLRSLFRRHRVEQELADELDYHLEQQVRIETANGVPADDARRAALRALGNVQAQKELCRDVRGFARLDDLVRDVRYAGRGLRRSPGFSALVVLIAAIGIGATTTVFTVINGILIKPLPYPDPDALVSLRLHATHLNIPGNVLHTASLFFTYRGENRTFRQLGLWSSDTVSITGVGEPEQVRVVRATSGTLDALGVVPAIGRWFSQQDDNPARAETVILTDGYWKRRLAADRSVIGRTVTIDAQPHEVIAIMPAGFRFLDASPDVILPLRFDRARLHLGGFNYQGLARLRPGATVAHANADVARMLAIWIKSWPPPPGANVAMFENAGFVPALLPLHQDVVGDVGGVLWLLMGTIGIVLLIACANVANLLLVRAQTRHAELAVRAALGAGWWRIARELLCESLVLGVISGGLGLAVAVAGVRVIAALAPRNLPRLDEIAIDPAVLGFVAIVSILSGILFALVPIAKHAGPRIAEALRANARTSSDSRERHRARNTLVAAQVAFALVLLVGSGLMIRTFQALRAVQPGFSRPEQAQLLRVTIASTQVSDPVRVLRVLNDMRDRIAAVSGVTSVAFTSSAPMEGFNSGDPIFVEGRSYARAEVPPIRRFKFVSPDVFAATGTTLVAGRDFTWSDLYDKRPVAIVSASLARELWVDPSAAVGKRIRESPADPWREVIGVVADVYDNGVQQPPPAIVYWPALMEGFWGNSFYIRRDVTFVVRSPQAGTEGLMSQLRAAVWSVDPNVPLAFVRTLADVSARSMARTSFTLVMLAVAASMALVLGVAGIYGAISYTVAQRTREIGIRMALGAHYRQLRRMFVREGVVLAVAGAACGLVAALVLARFMTAMLFGVTALDPATYVTTCVVLIAAAAVASYVPARRATTVPPIEALRAE